MPRDREEEAKLVRQKTRQAIEFALAGRWREAIDTNKTILEVAPDDVDAYNRLGRAYLEVGEYAMAREAYRRALELDPYNTIAQKNLRRLADLSETVGQADNPGAVEPGYFIEETGRSGVVGLYRLGPTRVRARLVAGDRVELRVQDDSLAVFSTGGDYVGLVEPRRAQRLIKLMKGGNRYSAVVASSSDEAMSVMIRLVYQHPSQAGVLSFPPLAGRVYEGVESGLEDETEEGYIAEEGDTSAEEDIEEIDIIEEEIDEEDD